MTKYSLPPLKDIIGAGQTEKDALEYLFANGLILNRENSLCGKQNTKKTSNRTTIVLDPCEGRLAYPTLKDNKYYWRCTSNSCRYRHRIFEGTLLDGFRESIADTVLVLYLSMSFVEQQTICCMTRLNRKTVQKLQETVRTVKAIDRGTWDDSTLKVGGFFEKDAQHDKDDHSGSQMENSNSSDAEDEDSIESVRRPSKKPKATEPVIAGTEYPHLLGKKVGGGAVPAVPGMIRKYNFKEEAIAKLEEAKAQKKNHGGRKSNAAGTSSSSTNTMMRADGKSSSGAASRNEDEVLEDDMEDEPSVDEYRFFVGSGRTNVDDNTADAKRNGDWSLPQRMGGSGDSSHSLIWLDFEIPEYATTSAPDDAEGVDKSQYRMKEAQIDESLFGKQKYHKGHPVPGTWVLGVCEEGQNADRKKLRLEVCANRNQATLTTFIVKYVRPGTWLAHTSPSV